MGGLLRNKFGLDGSNQDYKDTKNIYANKVMLNFIILKLNFLRNYMYKIKTRRRATRSNFHTKEFQMVCEKMHWKMAKYNMIVLMCYRIIEYNRRSNYVVNKKLEVQNFT